MRSFVVPASASGVRLDHFLYERFPSLSQSVIRKAFRDRDVKVNGVREKDVRLLMPGECVELFVSEDRLSGTGGTDAERHQPFLPPLHIAFEDKDILVLSKPQGVLVQQDAVEKSTLLSLEEQLRREFKKRGEPCLSGFPAPCHRIDRNTGGLVVFAKNPETLDVLETLFYQRDVRKQYLCVVVGVPQKQKDELNAYLEKVPGDSRVYIHDRPKAGSKPIKTRYEVLAAMDNLALLLVEIITGRTHQIRAQLAWIGYPIAGDGKYGSNTVNRRLHLKHQALWSWRITFGKSLAQTSLAHLAGLCVTADITWEGQLQEQFEELTKSLSQD